MSVLIDNSYNQFQSGNASVSSSNSYGSIVEFPHIQEQAVQMPEQVEGKLLCDDPELAPTDEVLKLALSKIRRIKLSPLILEKGEHFDIRTETGGLYSGGIASDRARRPIKQGEFILNNKNDEPIAVCLQERKKVHRAFVILGRTPRFSEDQPIVQEGGVDFYPHYRISSYNMSPFENRSISVWNGTDYEPIMTIKVTDSKFRKEQVRITSLSSEAKEQTFAVLQRCNKNDWTMSIANGMDPVMALCSIILIQNYVQNFSRHGFQEKFR